MQARDGEEGIELTAKVFPSLILLDIQLPVMDGYEAARVMCSNPLIAGVPIIAVISYAMAGDRERTIEAGCTGYIEKPVNPETLIDDIERHLSLSSRKG